MFDSQELNWNKADKPYPKKSPTLTSTLGFVPRKSGKADSDFKSVSNSEFSDDGFSTSSGGVSIKDLCAEDKKRIANLIKELAKIVEEKKQVESQLELERKQKEADINEILRQHQSLMKEKEAILSKLSKTQQKIAEIKNRQLKSSDTLPPKPVAKEQNEKVQKIKSNHCDEKLRKGNDSVFNPFTSSTPKNMSPRSLSPVSEKQPAIETNQSNQEEARKLELMQQRVELFEEQKLLKNMLDIQDKMLKEKQNEILIQQRLHEERLEELNRIKTENQRSMMVGEDMPGLIPGINYMIPPPAPTLVPPVHPAAYYPLVYNQPPPPAIHNRVDAPQIRVDDENLESLASLVYKKLLLKRKKTKTPLKQESCQIEDDLIRMVNQIDLKHDNVDRSEANINEQGVDEESKLLEDLFFLK